MKFEILHFDDYNLSNKSFTNARTLNILAPHTVADVPGVH